MSKIFPVVVFLSMLSSCATSSFQADKRQLIAKDLVNEKLGRVREYDVTSFKEDTVTAADGKPALQYTLGVSYKDSTGTWQNQQGVVVFTKEGNQVISTSVSPK